MNDTKIVQGEEGKEKATDIEQKNVNASMEIILNGRNGEKKTKLPTAQLIRT